MSVGHIVAASYYEHHNLPAERSRMLTRILWLHIVLITHMMVTRFWDLISMAVMTGERMLKRRWDGGDRRGEEGNDRTEAGNDRGEVQPLKTARRSGRKTLRISKQMEIIAELGDEDDRQEIRLEQEEQVARMEDLILEFETKYQEMGIPLIDFFEGYWHKRTRLYWIM
ncbi:hypothetical protein MMC30_009098 [Trapelia coarctata]|nr:hypothetical protein [Trapelia coarctata]